MSKKYGVSWLASMLRGKITLVVLSTIAAILNGIAFIGISYSFRMFVDIAAGQSNVTLKSALLLALLVVAAIGIACMSSSVLEMRLYTGIEEQLRKMILTKIFSSNLRDIEELHTGEILTRTTSDVANVAGLYPAIINEMVFRIITAIIAMIVLFMMSWKLSLVMLVATPILLFTIQLIGPKISKAAERDMKNEEQNRIYLQESYAHTKLYKAYGMTGNIIQKAAEYYANTIKSKMKLGLWNGVVSFSGNMGSVAIFMISMGAGAYFAQRGEITVGVLVATVQLINYVVMPITSIADYTTKVRVALESAKRIGAVMELPTDRSPALLSGAEIGSPVSLDAKNLAFSYDGKVDVLKGVNASFSAGQVTGLVGKSGSGKSTMTKLLIGLYQPKQGEVSLTMCDHIICGNNILENTAYVPSDNLLFSGTFSENIVMTHEIDRERLEDVARKADIYEYISSLPRGFDTTIQEGGSSLSSGQIMRVAIARALYRGAPVLVLDEPTANLDQESVATIIETIRKIKQNKICIVITHSDNPETFCDEILHMEEINHALPRLLIFEENTNDK